MNVYVDAFAQRAAAEALDRFTDAVIAYLERRLIVVGKVSFAGDSAPPSQMHRSVGNRSLVEDLNASSRKGLAEAQV